MRYRLEASSASKRAINGMAANELGSFYGGKLDQIELQLNWRLMSFLILEFAYENNIARIPAGDFNKELISTRAAINVSSDLNLSLFVQYDNESSSVGTYSRLRWTFAPVGDLFIVSSVALRTISAFAASRSSRLIPGLRGSPAVMTMISESAVAS